MTPKTKMKMREKIALACFMESVPLLIEKWQKDASEKTFDEYLLNVYADGKALQQKNKKEVKKPDECDSYGNY